MYCRFSVNIFGVLIHSWKFLHPTPAFESYIGPPKIYSNTQNMLIHVSKYLLWACHACVLLPFDRPVSAEFTRTCAGGGRKHATKREKMIFQSEAITSYCNTNSSIELTQRFNRNDWFLSHMYTHCFVRTHAATGIRYWHPQQLHPTAAQWHHPAGLLLNTISTWNQARSEWR